MKKELPKVGTLIYNMGLSSTGVYLGAAVTVSGVRSFLVYYAGTEKTCYITEHMFDNMVDRYKYFTKKVKNAH